MCEFLNVKQVMEICGIGRDAAYKLIKEINRELNAQHIVTYRGKVVKHKLYQKIGRKGEQK